MMRVACAVSSLRSMINPNTSMTDTPSQGRLMPPFLHKVDNPGRTNGVIPA